MKTEFSDIRCIAFDLDDTFLNEALEVTPRTREVMTRAVEAGIVLLPISGRPFSAFPDSVLRLPSVSYVVTGNGSAVYDARNRERVHEWTLKGSDVRTVMRSVSNFFLEGQIAYEAFYDGEPYAAADYVADPRAFGIKPSIADYIHASRHPVPYMVDFIYEHADHLDSLDLILKDYSLYPMIASTIRRNVPDIYITSSTNYRLEMTHAEAGKPAGLACALEFMKLTPAQTMAFGNGDNDAEMLAAAGIGVAVANSTEHCKECADYVTEGTNNDDALADFVEKHLL